MGKKISIVLLTVTFLVAVWTFVSMLNVDPEEDVKAALAAEERIAGQVAARLLGDEAFLADVSAKVETAVPGYVAEWVSSDAFKAMINELKVKVVTETVATLMDGDMLNVIADAALARLAAEDSPMHQNALAALAGRVAGELDIEAQVLAMLEEAKPGLIEAALAEVLGIPAEEKAEIIEAAVLTVYENHQDEIAEGIIAKHETAAETEAMIDSSLLSLRAELAALNEEYTAKLLEEVNLLIAQSRPDIEKEALALYEKYGDALSAEIIAKHDITAEVAALIEESKEAPVDVELEVLALYEKYGEALAAEIIAKHDITAEVAALIEESKEAPVDVEAEVLALYEKYGEALSREIIAKHDITAEVAALIEESKEAPVDVELEVLALYEKYGDALAAEIISKHDITAEVAALIEESKEAPVDIEAEVLALYEKYGDALSAEIIAKHDITAELEALIASITVEEEAAASIMASPAFGDAVVTETGSDEYNAYRSSLKSEALSQILSIIGE